MSDYLFVYGTLRQAVGHPLLGALRERAKWEGRARFPGHLYDLGPYPAAVPDGTGASQVVGELYRLTEPGPLLEVLDAYEGCDPDDPARGDYRRELQPVEREDGPPCSAWVYLYNKSLQGAQRIESGDYLDPHGKDGTENHETK